MAPRNEPGGILFSPTLFILAASLVGLTAWMLGSVSSFEQVFIDFKVELPFLTQVYLDIARTLHPFRWPIAITTPILVGFLPMLLGRGWRTADPERALRLAQRLTAINIGLFLAMLFAAVSFLAMILPFFRLVSAVSG